MPNTFVALDVPTSSNGAGAPVSVATTGHPKSLVAAGRITGRYVVEGSNDGGETWDILKDDNDGTEALFTSENTGAKSVDCVIERVRVRSVRALPTTAPPTLTLGAPPALGPNFFGKLQVPEAAGLGAPLDLGLTVGPLKTFILRGAVPPRARFTILASMDGVRFDEAMLFTSDRQGARSVSVMCRYLRVQRSGAAGIAPSISVGAEPVVEAAGGGGSPAVGPALLSLAFDPKRGVTSVGEEVLYEYAVPLRSLPSRRLVAELCAIAESGGDEGSVLFRVRVGGTLRAADGAEVAALATAGVPAVRVGTGDPFDRPDEPATLVKITGVNAGAMLAGFFLSFRAAE
ncbi:MAG: hypothetical protein SFX73_08410 [Kofleriaceae bacterium]|nr:hypothetical protein [Kofleriaceae bacterium]